MSFDGKANDGKRGEHDNVAADFEYVGTGFGNDTLIGDDRSTTFYATGGNDTITGGGGRDVLRGGAGADVFHARDGRVDRIWGGEAIDTATDRDPVDRLHDVEAF